MRDGARQRVLRAERPRGAAPGVRGAGDPARRRRRGGAAHGPRLRARARVRHAADRRLRHRRRSHGHALHGLALGPRRRAVSAAAPRGGPRGARGRGRRARTGGGRHSAPVNLPLWIAARYLRTRRRSAFITLLTGISIAGVAVGVTALLTVLAVMNGFENEIQSRIAGTDAHVVLLGDTQAAIRDGDSLAARAGRQPGVLGAAPFTYAKAMIIHEGRAEGLVVKGVDLSQERRVTTVARNIAPALDSIPAATTPPGLVLGGELAARIGAAVGDTVVLASLAADRSAMGYAPKLRRFRIVGLFSSGLYTYDSSFGFIAIPAAQEFFDLGPTVTGIEVRLADMFDAPRVAARLLRALGGGLGLHTNNWIELNRNLFTWMKLEKTVMFVILALIVLVA
ncbi:MAG: hypothetical protein E6K80_05180, partial [Candidatus Eisenbacteria bacterium]